MKQQQPETVQLFFNGGDKSNIESKLIDKNVYKDYIIQQNQILLKDNKNITKEINDLKKEYEELEDESMTIEKRFKNTKDYLKNFRFINDNLEKSNQEIIKFMKNLNPNKFLLELRMIISLFSLFICLSIILGFNQWWLILPLNGGYLYLFNNHICNEINSLLKKKNTCIRLNKDCELENKKMKKTMDIISEFIDNAL